EGAERARVPQTVAVIDAPRQHIGDRLDAAVRMPGKSCAIVFRAIVAEVVEQKEWIEFARIPEAEGATQLHARAFNRGLGLDDALHGSNGHDGLTSCSVLVLLTAPSPRWSAPRRQPPGQRTNGLPPPRTDRLKP